MTRPPTRRKGPIGKVVFLARREAIVTMLRQGHSLRDTYAKYGDGIGHESQFGKYARAILKAELTELRGAPPGRKAAAEPPFEADRPVPIAPAHQLGERPSAAKPQLPRPAPAKPPAPFKLQTMTADDYD